jgi:site-specific DNA-cytosine methylase
MWHLSLFSGAGGLEHSQIAPVLACERDPACIRVLSRRLPGIRVHRDVRDLRPPAVDVVVGGWPCQDVSSAGSMTGISGDRSGLFFTMVDVAIEAGAHSIVGENVPYLRSINSGRDFDRLLAHLDRSGFPCISWRTLNAREFGLAQDRKRIFVVASRYRQIARSLHLREPLAVPASAVRAPRTAGFYWTGGGRSICFSRGFVPALKVGAADTRGRSVVALFRDGRTWKLSADGCARPQGFEPSDFQDESKTDTIRMAGNAVPVPMGRFVLDLVFDPESGDFSRSRTGIQTGFAQVTEHGFVESGMVWSVDHRDTPLANDLDFGRLCRLRLGWRGRQPLCRRHQLRRKSGAMPIAADFPGIPRQASPPDRSDGDRGLRPRRQRTRR